MTKREIKREIKRTEQEMRTCVNTCEYMRLTEELETLLYLYRRKKSKVA